MSEFHPNTRAASVDFQLESLIADLESKFIAAEDALSELRHAVRGLKSYRPPAVPEAASQIAPAAPPAFAADPEPTRNQVTSAEVEAPPMAGPKLEDETVGVPFWPGPKTTEPEPDLNPRRHNYEMDSTSEGSWPIAWPAAVAEPMSDELPEIMSAEGEQVTAVDAGDEDEEAGREAVSNSVAQIQDSRDSQESWSEVESAQEPDDEATRRDVAKMVSELRDSVEEEPEGHEEVVSTPDEDEDETPRQEVARMAAEMRTTDLETSEPEEAIEDGSDDEARRQEVARVVAEMRTTDLETSEPEAAIEDDGDDDEARRQEVARVVRRCALQT